MKQEPGAYVERDFILTTFRQIPVPGMNKVLIHKRDIATLPQDP